MFEHPSRLLCSYFSWKVVTFRSIYQSVENEIWLWWIGLYFLENRVLAGRCWYCTDALVGIGLLTRAETRAASHYLDLPSSEWFRALTCLALSRTWERPEQCVHMVTDFCKHCKTVRYLCILQILCIFFIPNPCPLNCRKFYAGPVWIKF